MSETIIEEPRCSQLDSADWLGRVRELQADAAKLKAFVEAMPEDERNETQIRTVNQVIARGWAMAIQMQAVVIQHERPNDQGEAQPPAQNL